MDAGTESGLIFCLTIEKRPFVGKTPTETTFFFWILGLVKDYISD